MRVNATSARFTTNRAPHPLARDLHCGATLPRSEAARPPLGPCAAVFISAFVLSAIGCRQTPSEPPAPAPRIVSETVTNEVRCVKPLASVAPAPVAPAASSKCPQPALGATPLIVIPIRIEGVDTIVSAEFARSPEETARGLMYRTSLGDKSGMLFDLRERGTHEFWMRNTCIPLDMIFIDEDGTIVGVYEWAVPLTETSRGVGCASRYVLEVAGGWARSHGVQPGKKVTLPR